MYMDVGAFAFVFLCFASLIAFFIILALVFIVAWLGGWMVGRRKLKDDLLKRIDENIEKLQSDDGGEEEGDDDDDAPWSEDPDKWKRGGK